MLSDVNRAHPAVSFALCDIEVSQMTDRPIPPVAEQRPHSFTHHGITIEDPWHWLRDPNYPKVDDARRAGVPDR